MRIYQNGIIEMVRDGMGIQVIVRDGMRNKSKMNVRKRDDRHKWNDSNRWVGMRSGYQRGNISDGVMGRGRMHTEWEGTAGCKGIAR